MTSLSSALDGKPIPRMAARWMVVPNTGGSAWGRPCWGRPEGWWPQGRSGVERWPSAPFGPLRRREEDAGLGRRLLRPSRCRGQRRAGWLDSVGRLGGPVRCPGATRCSVGYPSREPPRQHRADGSRRGESPHHAPRARRGPLRREPGAREPGSPGAREQLAAVLQVQPPKMGCDTWPERTCGRHCGAVHQGGEVAGGCCVRGDLGTDQPSPDADYPALARAARAALSAVPSSMRPQDEDAVNVTAQGWAHAAGNRSPPRGRRTVRAGHRRR